MGTACASVANDKNATAEVAVDSIDAHIGRGFGGGRGGGRSRVTHCDVVRVLVEEMCLAVEIHVVVRWLLGDGQRMRGMCVSSSLVGVDWCRLV